MAQKKWSVEEKLRIVLSGLAGDVSISELCRREGVTETTFYRWREAFLEGGKSALAGNGPSSREQQLERENKQLKEALGEQMLANRLLKKLHGLEGIFKNLSASGRQKACRWPACAHLWV